MSRLTKAAEFLFGEYLNKDEAVTPFEKWSPNNVKTLMIGSMLIGVEFFIACDIGKGMSKYNYGKLGDLDVDMDVLKSGNTVRSVLRVLRGYKVCNNIEEIIICSEMYDKRLLQLDTDLFQLTSNDIAEVFPRLYAVTVVDGKAADIFATLNSASRSEEHITDVLSKDSRFITHPYYVHKNDWNKRFYLEPDLYLMDYDSPTANDPVSKYALYTYFINRGGVSKSETMTGFDFLQKQEIEHPGVVCESDIKCQFVYDVEEAVLCVANPVSTTIIQKTNAFTGLCKNVVGSVEDYLQGWHNCTELHITKNGMIRLNGKVIKPMLGYDVINRLPAEMQYLLFAKEPLLFQQEMQKKFGRVLIIDADRNEFFKYCQNLAVSWGHFLSLQDLTKMTNLKTLRIDCPHLLSRYKYNMGVTEWSDLYTKVPSLSMDGIYVCGVHISNGNEKDFYNNYERKLTDCIGLQTDILKELGLMLPYYPVLMNTTGVASKVTQAVSNISCKLSSIFHRLNEEQ